MDIGLYTRYFNDWNKGIGVYSKNILREMIKKGHNVHSHSTKSKGMLGYAYYTSVSLFKELKMPSLMPTHDLDVYHALTPLESIWMPREKTVTTFHDLIPMLHREEETWYFSGPLSFFRRKLGGMWFELGAKIGAESEAVICNSKDTKENVKKHLDVPEEKITVTRLGIDKRLEPVKDTTFDTENYTVGTLSYLDPRKRIDMLIRSFKEIGDPDSELLIPSTGKDEDRLKRIAGSDDRIKFLGYIQEKDKADYLSSLDVFILPSKLEGYGLPWVEAMACKTPVVSLKDALIPDDVKKRTHVISKEKLTDAMREKNFDCDISANYKFSQEHSWKVCAEETVQVYRQVIE